MKIAIPINTHFKESIILFSNSAGVFFSSGGTVATGGVAVATVATGGVAVATGATGGGVAVATGATGGVAAAVVAAVATAVVAATCCVYFSKTFIKW